MAASTIRPLSLDRRIDLKASATLLDSPPDSEKSPKWFSTSLFVSKIRFRGRADEFLHSCLMKVLKFGSMFLLSSLSPSLSTSGSFASFSASIFLKLSSEFFLGSAL